MNQPPSADLGVALPPPDPPKWRLALGVLVVLAAIAVVVLVVRLVPQRVADPLRPMPADVRQRVQAATVWVVGDAPEGQSEGSGFVSKPGFVLTNAHVVEHTTNLRCVLGCGTPQSRTVPAKVLRLGRPGEVDDIALLALNTGAVQPLRLASAEQAAEGTPLAAFGYPLGSTLTTSSQGPQISIRGGTVTARRKDDAGRLAWLESDVLAEVGNSGGPVVTFEGRVLGLATMLVGPNLRTARIVPAEMLQRFAAGSVTK